MGKAILQIKKYQKPKSALCGTHSSALTSYALPNLIRKKLVFNKIKIVQYDYENNDQQNDNYYLS